MGIIYTTAPILSIPDWLGIFGFLEII
jgi:hypothetical protein